MTCVTWDSEDNNSKQSSNIKIKQWTKQLRGNITPWIIIYIVYSTDKHNAINNWICQMKLNRTLLLNSSGDNSWFMKYCLYLLRFQIRFQIPQWSINQTFKFKFGQDLFHGNLLEFYNELKDGNFVKFWSKPDTFKDRAALILEPEALDNHRWTTGNCFLISCVNYFDFYQQKFMI